ncbi:MAG: ATP-binding protein [Gammaproteobacteria bacterium]
MRSLAQRITVSLVIGGGAVFGALFIWLDLAIDHELFSRFDAALLARARALAGVVSGRPVERAGVEQRWPEYAASGHQEFYQLWAGDGRVVARSASSRGADLAQPPRADSLPVLYDLRLPDGHRGRAVALSAWPVPGSALPAAPHLLVVATEREALDRLEQRLHWSLLLGTFVALMVMALVSIMTVRGGLAPLVAFGRRLATRVSVDAAVSGQAQVGESRLPATFLPAELVPIAETLNQAIDEALTALRREQRFAREAAHELRTPLAEMRLIAQAIPAANADTAALLQVVDRMTRSIEALLALARCEAGLDVPALEPLDLSVVVREEIVRHADECRGRDLTVETVLPDELWVMSDPAMIERIVANLIGNAVMHAPASGQLSVRLEGSAERAMFTVRNPAPGLAAERLAAAVRNGARAASTGTGDGHAGIGLALVAALARQLELELDFRNVDADLEVVLSAISLVPDAR